MAKCGGVGECGGVGGEEPADKHIQALCDQVKNDVEGKSGEKYHVFKAVSFASQVVAGTNYFIKVDVGKDNYVHVRIYKPIQGDPSVDSVQTSKAKADKIEYF